MTDPTLHRSDGGEPAGAVSDRDGPGRPGVREAAASPEPQTQFNDEQVGSMLAYVRSAVESAVRGEPLEACLPPAIDRAPAFGVFVTLRRPTLLRACRGRWGGPLTPLGSLLAQVVRDAATLDPRFPSVTPEELPYLAIDISLMFDPAPVGAVGEDRIGAIVVGTHGLVIDHPRGKGLLLPHVATEAGWDAKTFLDQLAVKAGLPADTWRRDPTARLMTFQTRLFTSEAPDAELDIQHLQSAGLHRLVAVINLMLEDRAIDDQVGEALTTCYEQELGVHLETGSGMSATAVAPGRSLLDLAMAAVRSLRELFTKHEVSPEPVKRIGLLWQPVCLVAGDYPSRHGLLSASAVRIRREDNWGVMMPGGFDPVGGALEMMQMNRRDWQELGGRGQAQLTAFSVLNFESRQKPVVLDTRPPSRAGQFYPADPGEMNNAIDRYLAAVGGKGKQRREACRAVMLPHAGWVYCGETIAKTLARVAVPETVIVIGPKHTAHGPGWSVASHDRWDIPGASIPIDTGLVRRLRALTSGLECEPDAHRLEHGCEVLLPFLQRVSPRLRAVPVVMGGALSYEATAEMAQGLAALISQVDPAPLLVISSDMNHFASEPENRRLDHIALDAMLSGSASMLFDTCNDHDISMCGLLPAVAVMRALAATKPLDLELVDYSNSAQATGDTSRVVGYAGVVIK